MFVGDFVYVMFMYCGEVVNYGILDVQYLVIVIFKVYFGKISMKIVIDQYEYEMREWMSVVVLLS